MEIIIYTFPMCSRCKTLELLLNKYNIRYKAKKDEKKKFDSEYPHVFIDGNKISYENVLQKIKDGEI